MKSRLQAYRIYLPSWKLPVWQWGVILALCVGTMFFFNTIFFLQTYLLSDATNPVKDSPIQVFWQMFLPGEFTRRLTWLYMMPIALHYIRLFPIQSSFGSSAFFLQIARHLALSLVFALTCGVLTVLSAQVVVPLVWQNLEHGVPSIARLFTLHLTLISGFTASVVLYWGMLVVVQAVAYFRAFRYESLRAADLETKLAKAHLAALQSQLQPHFLFNALNSVSSLLYEDVRRADSMITRLADFLRSTLSVNLFQEITLEEEYRFAQQYICIEEMRFEERLRVVWDIQQEAKKARVPTFILQPLIENALKHGIAPFAGGGEVRIIACVEGKRLRVEVHNMTFVENKLEALPTSIDAGMLSPLQFEKNYYFAAEQPETPVMKRLLQQASSGIGLANTRERLERLYESAASLEIISESTSEFSVRITIPYTPLHD